MGFSSLNDMISEIGIGKFMSCQWNKITGAGAYTAGVWYNTFTLGGSTDAGTYPNTAKTATALTDINTEVKLPGVIQHGGNKSTDTKHILNMDAMCSIATGNPSYLLLVDMLAYYQGIDMNISTLQTMLSSTAGTNILPNRQGVQHNGTNVFAFLEAQTALGGVTRTFTVTYTNSGLSTPKTTSACSLLTNSVTPALATSQLSGGTTFFAPFIPLSSGDKGIASVQSLQLAVGGTGAGTACLVLCEPIAKIPIVAQGCATARDYIFNMPTLPQIKDGACLSFLLYSGGAVAASTNFNGTIDVAWG